MNKLLILCTVILLVLLAVVDGCQQQPAPSPSFPIACYIRVIFIGL